MKIGSKNLPSNIQRVLILSLSPLKEFKIIKIQRKMARRTRKVKKK
jgi:hypothetical protein